MAYGVTNNIKLGADHIKLKLQNKDNGELNNLQPS
jgi:hypothetical protein